MNEPTTPAGATPTAGGATPPQTPPAASAPAPQTEPAADPSPPDGLGDAGKRALDAMKATRLDRTQREAALADLTAAWFARRGPETLRKEHLGR